MTRMFDRAVRRAVRRAFRRMLWRVTPPPHGTLQRALWLAVSAAAACGRSERPPPDRPSQPTLTVAPDPSAPTTGRRVVAFGQIDQPWRVGAFSPASITLSEVAAGDAILVLGAYWGDLAAESSTAPTDEWKPGVSTTGSRGDPGAEPPDERTRLTRIIDQGWIIVGRKKPPVFTQLYAAFDPAPGAHTIVPPYLGGQAGDGTMYVLQVRGLTDRRVATIGQAWTKHDAQRGVSTSLERAAAPGDLIVGLGAYDNTQPIEHPGWTPPPPGWRQLGSQDDASNNVPSALWVRTADSPLAYQVTWGWADPTVNVTVAVIAAVR